MEPTTEPSVVEKLAPKVDASAPPLEEPRAALHGSSDSATIPHDHSWSYAASGHPVTPARRDSKSEKSDAGTKRSSGHAAHLLNCRSKVINNSAVPRWMWSPLFRFWLAEPLEFPSLVDPTPAVFRHRFWKWLFLPFKHRVCRLGLSMLALLATTSLVFGWQPFSAMLFADGAYGDLCTPEEAARAIRDRVDVPVCKEQDNAIQSLYLVALCCEFVFGCLAGVMMDIVGPFVTGSTGHLFLFGGLALLAAGSTYSNLYLPSMILLGASINFIIYPTLIFADYFPSFGGLIISLVIAAQSGGSVTALILHSIFRASDSLRFAPLILMFSVAVVIPSAVLYIFSLPLIRPSLLLVNIDSPQSPKLSDLTTSSERLLVPETFATTTPSDRQFNYEGFVTTTLPLEANSCNKHFVPSASLEFQVASDLTPPADPIRKLHDEPSLELICEELHNIDPMVSPALQVGESDADHDRIRTPGFTDTATCERSSSHNKSTPNELSTCLSKLNPSDSGINLVPVVEDHHVPAFVEPVNQKGFSSFKQQLISVGRDAMTFEMIGIGIFTFFTVIQANYYQIVVRDVSGSKIADFNGYLFPSQAILGIFYGIAVDYTTTLPICYFLLALFAAVYIFFMIPSHGLQYATTVLFILGSTYIYTIRFNYLREIFSPKNYGSLLAILSLLGGSGILLNIPLKRIDNFNVVSGVLLVTIALCFTVIYALHTRARSGIRHLSDCSKTTSLLTTPKSHSGVPSNCTKDAGL